MPKTFYHRHDKCFECNIIIENRVYHFSMDRFKIPLCISCQRYMERKLQKATAVSFDLYVALKLRGVPAELEKYDGHKTIDIAITDAMVNIEVDGVHHNYDAQQALSDLKRTYYAFKKGYLTLRVPNSLVRENLDETADVITKFLNDSRDQLEEY